MAAERERLPECEPALTCEVTLDDRAPENQHINATILPAGRGVLRHRERRLRRPGAPRLNPRHAADLKLRDDLVGDFVINARPVLACASWGADCLDIADRRDCRCEPLPQLSPFTAEPAALLTLAQPR